MGLRGERTAVETKAEFGKVRCVCARSPLTDLTISQIVKTLFGYISVPERQKDVTALNPSFFQNSSVKIRAASHIHTSAFLFIGLVMIVVEVDHMTLNCGHSGQP